MIPRIRIGVIGCGNIALSGHLPAVLSHPRFLLVGLCDVRADRTLQAQAVCQSLSSAGNSELAIAGDYRELVSENQLDACIVALHPEASVRVVVDLLRRGIAVLDEKPLATNLEQGLHLAEVVKQTGGVYQIGFCTRYCRLIGNTAESVGRLGAPLLFQVSIYDESLAQCQGEYGAMIEGILRHSSAITHEGSHVIDWMSLLYPSPIRTATAFGLKTQNRFPGPNLWSVDFGFADGSTLQLTIGWLLRNQPASMLRVLGPEGFLEMDIFNGVGRLAAGEHVEELYSDGLCQAWNKQLDAFATAIDRGRVADATVYDGLRALRATLACEQSARLGVTVQVEDGEET